MKKSILIISITTLVATATLGQNKKGERPDGLPSIEQLFKDLDSNEDGKLSLKEVRGPLKKDFNKVDLNEDGFITKEELEKAPKPKRRGNQRK